MAVGLDVLQVACDKIGYCPTGEAVITPAFHLNTKYIIHAVGPRWFGGCRHPGCLPRAPAGAAPGGGRDPGTVPCSRQRIEGCLVKLFMWSS